MYTDLEKEGREGVKGEGQKRREIEVRGDFFPNGVSGLGPSLNGDDNPVADLGFHKRGFLLNFRSYPHFPESLIARCYLQLGSLHNRLIWDSPYLPNYDCTSHTNH